MNWGDGAEPTFDPPYTRGTPAIEAPSSPRAASPLLTFVKDHADPSFVVRAHKLQPPQRRAVRVSRRALVGRLRRPEVELGVVAAPAGYGKSTLLGELARTDGRATCWLTLDAADNDPVVLLTYLALAIDAVEPVDPLLVAPWWSPAPSVVTQALPRFASHLASREVPLLLVLDDVHVITSPEALDVLAVLVAELPAGCLLVLGGRSAPTLPFGRLRVKRGVVELGLADLAFTEADAATMYRALGVDDSPDVIRPLVAATEGWPAALYLAALSLRAGQVGVVDDLASGRLVADYLRDELLDGLEPEVATFLLGASCLERLSGPLCDAALGREQSAAMLDELERRNLLVIPLDHRREWYRLHHLLADLLRAELVTRAPDEARAIHARASTWFEAAGDPDAAIQHAVQAGDPRRVEALVWANFGLYTGLGRHATIQRWLGLFTKDQLSAQPLLAALMGFSRLPAGDGAGARLWLDTAETGLRQRPRARRVEPPELPASLMVALLRATVLEEPAGQMADDAAAARRGLPFGPWHAHASLMLGAAVFMVGNEDDAESLFEESVAEARSSVPNVHALALAHLAVLHVERGQWERAIELGREARNVLANAMLDGVPSLFLVSAASAMVEARAGRAALAGGERLRTLRQMVGFQRTGPWANLQARIALARASLMLGDRVAARTMLDETDRYLERVPDATRVKEQAAEVRRSLRDPRDGEGWGPSSLTTAEIRVLEYLPTHLTLVEIAERLHVSRNTVKTQAIAVYRKLGTSSRGAAVDAARRAGLLLDPML